MMITKTVFLYDENKAFAGVYEAQESPLEPGNFITPERSTEIEPPSFTELQTCHFVDGVWVVADSTPVAEPDPVPTEPQYKTQFDSLDFIDLFSETEQLAVVEATLQNAQIKLWYDKMLAANFVSLDDARTIGGLDALVSAGLITAARKAEILTPQLVQP